jgi:hypothetical protein
VNLSNNEVCTVQLLAATAGLVKKFRGGIFSADDCEIASIEAIFDGRPRLRANHSADDAEPLVCKCGNIAIKQTQSSHHDLFDRRLRQKEWFQRGTISMEVGELLS